MRINSDRRQGTCAASGPKPQRRRPVMRGVRQTEALVFIARLVLSAVSLSEFAYAANARWPTTPDTNNQVRLFDASTAPRCSTTTPQLTTRSLGPLRPGQSLSDLEKACSALRYGWAWSEGSPYPVVLLRLGEAPVVVEFSEPTAKSPVYRITTEFPVRTADGFGPGSQVAAMVLAWGEAHFGLGECELYVWFSKRRGLSFRVDVPTLDCAARGRVESTGNASLLPQGTRVTSVLLVGP